MFMSGKGEYVDILEHGEAGSRFEDYMHKKKGV